MKRTPRSACRGAHSPMHPAAGDLESGVQAGQPVSAIVVGLPRRQPWPQGQQWLGPAERLDLRLLIQAQDHGVRRGFEIQPDDIVDLGLRLGIGRELERRDPMRLERVGPPDAVHGAVRYPGLSRQVPRRPMGQAGRGRLQGERDNLGPLPRGDRRWSPGPGTVLEASDALFGEAAPQAADLAPRCSQSARRSPRRARPAPSSTPPAPGG